MYQRFCAHLIIVYLIIAIFGCIPQPTSELLCTSVIDGDTIKLSDETTVRYLGIDTPEVDEPLGPEATGANRKLVEGQSVRLKYDRERQGKYGRTLAYVYADDTFVNAELVRLGLAEIATYGQTLKLLDSLIMCQREAISNQRGIWLDAQDIVYITATGEKYHSEGCRYLKMQGTATDEYVNYVFAGGTLYPLGGRDPVFCPKCLNEMSQINATWICRHCTEKLLYYAKNL